MSDEEKPLDKWEDRDLGPKKYATVLGTAIGNYMAHGLSREEVLELVGDLYDEMLVKMHEILAKVPKH